MKTPHELACAISALINSKPRSPTIEELEGVIGEHIAVDDGADTSSATREWRWKHFPPRGLAKVSLEDTGWIDFTPAADPPVTVKLDEKAKRVWFGGIAAQEPGSWDPPNGTATLISLWGSIGEPNGAIYHIAPERLRDALGKTPESPRARWAGPPSVEIEGVGLSIYYADPLCLMCLPDEKAVRAINGSLIHPNRLYVRWYDDEHDQVCLEPVPSWGAAKALSPHAYDALMQARRADQMVAAMARKTDEQAAKPPMVAVVEPIRDSICLGGVGYGV